MVGAGQPPRPPPARQQLGQVTPPLQVAGRAALDMRDLLRASPTTPEALRRCRVD